MVGGRMSRVEGLGTRAVFSRLPGQPVPREGASLEQVSAVGRLLYLGQAQVAQEGTYTCECSSVAGNSSQEQRLEVHGELGRDDLAEAARGAGDWAPGRADPPPPQNSSQDRNSDENTSMAPPKSYGYFINRAPPISFLQRPPEHEQGG